MVSFFGTDTSPSSGSSSPIIMRKRVVLPAPLGPTRPTFSPGLSWKDASTKTSCLPYCLLMLEREIIGHEPSSGMRPERHIGPRMNTNKSASVIAVTWPVRLCRRAFRAGVFLPSPVRGRWNAARCGDGCELFSGEHVDGISYLDQD